MKTLTNCKDMFDLHINTHSTFPSMTLYILILSITEVLEQRFLIHNNCKFLLYQPPVETRQQF